jgi:hypothetical protein
VCVFVCVCVCVCECMCVCVYVRKRVEKWMESWCTAYLLFLPQDYNKYITHLDLSYNKIGDQGAEALSNIFVVRVCLLLLYVLYPC